MSHHDRQHDCNDDDVVILVRAHWVCFLVLSILSDLVLFKLLFLVLSLCLNVGDVARGGLSGSLQSEVEMSDKLKNCLLALWLNLRIKSELAKLGMLHWQQIHWLFWRALYAIVDIPMQSTRYHEFQ